MQPIYSHAQPSRGPSLNVLEPPNTSNVVTNDSHTLVLVDQSCQSIAMLALLIDLIVDLPNYQES